MKLKKKSLFSPKTFNYLYSIGASIVILGSLFKLLHVTGADLMLIIGMGTEAFIFFVSAFDEPTKEPNWENVYPGIYKQTLTEEEKQQIAERRAKQDAAMENAAHSVIQGGGATIIGGEVPNGGTIVIGSSSMSGASAQTDAPNLTPEQADQVAAATAKYVKQMNEINQSLEKLSSAMQGIGGNENYADQISQLNRNIQGLNTIYEIQLKNVSAQLATIEEVNRGLNNIRSLYENGQNDSYRIRQESDQLARNLQQLNEVYARMLSAMTTNYVTNVPINK
ncbi:MAG: gliding motility protein GldL [Bacteroidales bacterium]|nr:gliding motility protein GldL [Bacteroidales bacterium]MBP5214802.1 gliding motility protein GldL [Bacteroidales bacterium]MBP5764517.1 gliding motility protein GldL [Bacteroidales bacterium]